MLRIPKSTLRIAKQVATSKGISVNMLLADLITSALSQELIERGLPQRIVRETMQYLREHGYGDAPVAMPEPPPILPLVLKIETHKPPTKKNVRRTKRSAAK
ncbi:MAG: hypothetical protein ABSB50_03245 [Terracidiphilus sp.]|jgi:hypothetical protein